MIVNEAAIFAAFSFTSELGAPILLSSCCALKTLFVLGSPGTGDGDYGGELVESMEEAARCFAAAAAELPPASVAWACAMGRRAQAEVSAITARLTAVLGQHRA